MIAVGALNFEHMAGAGEQALCVGRRLDQRNPIPHPKARADRHRREKPYAIRTVIQRIRAVGGTQAAAIDGVIDKTQHQKSVRNGAAIRAFGGRAGGVCMQPMCVARHLGERIDPRLIHIHPR